MVPLCRYTTYNIKGQEDKTLDDHCLKALPVGQAIKVKRGEGGWLFADWDEDNTRPVAHGIKYRKRGTEGGVEVRALASC